PAGHPHDDRARRDAPALGDETAGRDDALRADLTAGQQQRAHADEGIATDAGTVQDGPVTDDNAFLDLLLQVVIRVDDAAILEVDAGAKGDPGQVAPDDGAVPDVDAGRQHHVARHHRIPRHVIIADCLHRRPLGPRALAVIVSDGADG